MAQELKAAVDRGVDVRIIFDAKENGKRKTAKSKAVAAFPRTDNLATIKDAGIPEDNVIPRRANQANIQHNKFIVFLPRGKTPVAVWTGSTNISAGGIFGQTNVGHWVRDKASAAKYLQYWKLLSGDPGMQAGDDRAKRTADNKAFKAKVVKIRADIPPAGIKNIPQGVTPIFSPRSTAKMLDTYAKFHRVHADLQPLLFPRHARIRRPARHQPGRRPGRPVPRPGRSLAEEVRARPPAGETRGNLHERAGREDLVGGASGDVVNGSPNNHPLPRLGEPCRGGREARRSLAAFTIHDNVLSVFGHRIRGMGQTSP